MANHDIRGAEYEYFLIRRFTQNPDRKSAEYFVTSRKTGSSLGNIRWEVPWRQYCFYPACATGWSAGCLADIQQFLDRLNEKKPKGG